MKLWVDDVRPAPEGYVWCKSVDQAKEAIDYCENVWRAPMYYPGISHITGPIDIEVIDCDHDAGDYAKFGGDYIKLLDWLEETGRNYPIRIHSMNPVGRENMRAIIRKNNWVEVI